MKRKFDGYKVIWGSAEAFRDYCRKRAKHVCIDDPDIVANMIEETTGKGVGSSILFYAPSYYRNWVFHALLQGYFDLVEHRDYSGAPGAMEERLTVSLTAKGMAYFDSLPRLTLECA